jgi:hypothetical protein
MYLTLFSLDVVFLKKWPLLVLKLFFEKLTRRLNSVKNVALALICTTVQYMTSNVVENQKKYCKKRHFLPDEVGTKANRERKIQL